MEATYVSGKIDMIGHGFVSGEDVECVIFSANLSNPEFFPGTTDRHPVFYIRLDRPFAAACEHAARDALNQHLNVDIIIDPHDPANAPPPGITAMRVYAVVPWHMSEKKPA